MSELRKTSEVVDSVLSTLTEAAWNADYPELKRGLSFKTHTFLAHLSVHLAFHLGQAGYLRRIVTGDGTSSAPLSLDELHTS